jgi:hypothetical protein
LSDSKASYAYLFETKGIQRYILDSGTLRDLVGASDLVAGMVSPDGNDLLANVLKVCGIQDEALSRRASGAFIVHSATREPLERLRELWRLTASLRFPGLEMSDVLLADAAAMEAKTAMGALERAYQDATTVAFNSAAELAPAGHSFTAFNARTGRLTTALYAYRDDVTSMDMVTEAQRARADALRGKIDGVAARFLPNAATSEPAAGGFAFPRNIDPREGDTYDNPLFPFRRRGGAASGDVDSRLAVVHADISGLGQAFKRIRQASTAPTDVFKAAKAIDELVISAVREAATVCLLPYARMHSGSGKGIVPARPIVLGGDDVTVIVRADLALPFVKRLLEEIECRSEALGASGNVPGLAERLSACAGLALVRAGRPFSMARALADDLCKFAKRTAKKGRTGPYPSLVAFHVAQLTVRESYDELRQRELTTPDGIILTSNPYGLKSGGQGTLGLDDLVALARALAPAPGTGNLIAAVRTMFDDPEGAYRMWERWRKVVDRENKATLHSVDRSLEGAGFAIDRAAAGPAWPAIVGLVSDALEWLDLGLVEALGDATEAGEPAAASAA